jgi:hypothetical protein
MQATSNRQPLPPVAGSPDLRVLRADPTPRAPSVGLSLSVGVTYLFPGAPGASQVPDASLRTCHALKTPPELDHLAIDGGFVSASVTVTASPSGSLPSRGGTTAFGAVPDFGEHDPLRPIRFSVYASASSFGLTLLRSCNTRYGWLARPYPVGTRTPQEAPS